GAFVDPGYQRFELREDNNAHASAMLGVGNRPDFVVTHVKGPVNVQTGQPLTAQVTVCNQGTQPEMAEVQLLLSADALLRPPTGNGPEEDAPVAFTAVGPLYPGQCAPVSMSGSANLPSPGLEGTYHLGAFVDPLNQRPELREDNNTHTLTRVGVGNGPDFVVTQVTGPPSALPGQPITAQVTVCNQGTEFETAEVAVLLSHDTLLRTDTGEDLIVGSTNVGPLYPGQCTTAPVTGPASPPGPAPGPSGFVLGAVVDPFNLRAELVEDNNTHTGFRMGIGNAPDFVVSAVTGVPSALPGQSFTANVTVCNNGQLGQMADVKVILSADAIIRVPSPSQPTEDFLLGTVSGVGLSPGKCVTRPLSVTVPSVPEGGYYLGAVVDPANVRAELIEDNNTLAVTRLGVGRLPDFVISSVTGSTSIKPGAPINTTTVICNRGQAGGTVDAELFLLTSPTVTLPPVSSEAFFLGRFSGLSLGAGQCVTRSLTVPAPAGLPEGTYHLGAVADLINARMELIEDNNVLAGSRIGVGFQPDFVVTAVSAPASVVRGAALTVSTTVCNQGSNVGSAEVDLFFSADTTVRAPSPYQPPEDFFLGTFAVTGLGVGQCITRPLTVSANAPTGLYYVGAVADPRSTTLEFFEDNNALAGTRVNVMP
ncbi:CARDB domain-containing protein, partial [Pyxidicoccus sp. 3LFB2]